MVCEPDGSVSHVTRGKSMQRWTQGRPRREENSEWNLGNTYAPLVLNEDGGDITDMRANRAPG